MMLDTELLPQPKLVPHTEHTLRYMLDTHPHTNCTICTRLTCFLSLSQYHTQDMHCITCCFSPEHTIIRSMLELFLLPTHGPHTVSTW